MAVFFQDQRRKYYEENSLEGTHDWRIKIKVPIKEEKKKAYLSVQQR